MLSRAGDGQGRAAGTWWPCCSGVHSYESVSSQYLSMRRCWSALTHRPWKQGKEGQQDGMGSEEERNSICPILQEDADVFGSESTHRRTAMLLALSHRPVQYGCGSVSAAFPKLTLCFMSALTKAAVYLQGAS